MDKFFKRFLLIVCALILSISLYSLSNKDDNRVLASYDNSYDINKYSDGDENYSDGDTESEENDKDSNQETQDDYDNPEENEQGD